MKNNNVQTLNNKLCMKGVEGAAPLVAGAVVVGTLIVTTTIVKPEGELEKGPGPAPWMYPGGGCRGRIGRGQGSTSATQIRWRRDGCRRAAPRWAQREPSCPLPSVR